MIQEQAGNLWDFAERGEWIAITTNGIVKTNGQAVMGSGLAEQAAARYPDLPRALGQHLTRMGNIPYCDPALRLISWPTKSDWKRPAEVRLIQQGAHAIRRILDREHITHLYCPPPGCGLGQLTWPQVREALTPLLDTRFIFLTGRAISGHPSPGHTPKETPMSNARALADRAREESQQTDPSAPITAFAADYFFLSTFAPAPVYVDHVQYPTVAHGLEATRVCTASDRDRIRRCENAGEMMRLAKSMSSRPDWETHKIDVLRNLLQQKFSTPDFRTRLLNTGSRPLLAHNYWRDRFWGIYDGEGHNWLGRLLMDQRATLQTTPPPSAPDDTLSSTVHARLLRATGLWYDLIAHDHHKDRDCHFNLTLRYSYAGERTIIIEHEGYIVEPWHETAPSLAQAADHLLIRICRQIDRECAGRHETDNENRTHYTQIHTALTELLIAWDMRSIVSSLPQ